MIVPPLNNGQPWRNKVLDENGAYKMERQKIAGREPGSSSRLCLNDDPSLIHILEGIAKLKSTRKAFVQARCMCTKDGKYFKVPANIGKDNLRAAVDKVNSGMAEDQLTKKEITWMFKAW